MNNEARDFINRGIDLFPQNLVLKDELCYNREIEGDIDGAISICNELIDKNPTPTNTGSHSDGYIRLNWSSKRQSKHSTLH